MNIWKRRGTRWSRQSILLATVWYSVLVSSAYLYYTYAKSVDKWSPTNLYNSLFPPHPPTVLVNDNNHGADHILVHVPEKARILREAGAGQETKDWTFPNPFKTFLPSDDENAHQTTKNKVPHRTSEENFMYSNEHTVPKAASNIINRTADRTNNHYVAAEGAADARAPVTATIDVTTIHYVNATVKPTLPPEVDGYEKVESGERLRMRCRQCAVVSSSGHLLNQSVGAEIDKAQCVIRMNSAQTDGFEEDVGKRTTVRVIGHVNMKFLNGSKELQQEIFKNETTRAETVIVPWLYNVHINKLKDKYYQVTKNFSKKYPDTDFFLLSPSKMRLVENLFHTETGLTRREAKTWLSTGWMTMLFAIDVCDKINVYGLVEENHCLKHPNDTTPYHYYEPNEKKECEYYKISEERLTSGHLFITEKAVFARWANKFNITFHYPAWNITEPTGNQTALETPFLKRFYEAKKNGTLNNTVVKHGVRRIVKRIVKKVIVRRKVPVVVKKPANL